MPYAVTLGFDYASASCIAATWEMLAELQLDNDRSQVGYPAHLTLAIYPDHASPDRISAAVADAAKRWSACPIKLSALAFFPPPSAVLWAVPVVTSELLAMHADLQNLLSDLQVDPHYATGTWIPHVTLSGSLRDPASTFAAVLPRWQPHQGILDRVELVSFRPATVLQTVPLSRNGAPFGWLPPVSSSRAGPCSAKLPARS